MVNLLSLFWGYFEANCEDYEGIFFIFWKLYWELTGYKNPQSSGPVQKLSEYHKPKQSLSLDSMTPVWWSYIDVLIFLWCVKRWLGIESRVVFHKNIYLKYRSVNNADLSEIDEEFYVRENYNIILDNPNTLNTLNESYLDFIDIDISLIDPNILYGVLESCIELYRNGLLRLDNTSSKKELLDRIKGIYIASNWEKIINITSKKKQSQFLYELWDLWLVGMIDISKLSVVSDFNNTENNWENEFFYDVSFFLNDELKKSIKLESENMIFLIEKFYDTKYTEYKITRKKGVFNLFEWEYVTDDMNISAIKRRHKQSSINVKTYNGSITKVTVRETLSLENNPNS